MATEVILLPMKTTTNKTPAETLTAALAAAKDAEARNLSAATQNKRWRAVFAAEDAVKASGAWS